MHVPRWRLAGISKSEDGALWMQYQEYFLEMREAIVQFHRL